MLGLIYPSAEEGSLSMPGTAQLSSQGGGGHSGGDEGQAFVVDGLRRIA